MPRRSQGEVVWEAVLDDGKARQTANLLQGAFASLGVFPGLSRASTQLTGINAALRRVGPLAAAVAGAFGAIALSISKAVQEFAAFETSLARVATTTGGTLAGISTQYGSLVQSISRETGIATDEIAAGIQKAISGGVTGFEQIRNLVGQAARFQAAGLGELAVAVSSATTLFANLGNEASESLNKIARAAQLGEGEVSDFSGAAKRLSVTAQVLGIDLETMLASISNLSQTAPSVGEAMINLEGVFRALIKPSEQAKEAFEGIGLAVEDLRLRVSQGDLTGVIRDIQREIADAGTEGAALAGQFFRNTQGLLGLVSLNADVIDDFTARIRQGDRAVDEAFGEIVQTMQFSFDRLETIWTTSWQSLGGLAVRATGFDRILREFTQGFDDLTANIASRALTFANRYEQIINSIFTVGGFVGGPSLNLTPAYLENIVDGIRNAALDLLDEQALQQEFDRRLADLQERLAQGGILAVSRTSVESRRAYVRQQLREAQEGEIALTTNQINRFVIEENYLTRLLAIASDYTQRTQAQAKAQEDNATVVERLIVDNEKLLQLYQQQSQAALAASRGFQQVQQLQGQLAVVQAQPAATFGSDQFFAQRRLQLEAERNAAYQEAANTLGVYTEAFAVQLMIIDATHRNALERLGVQSSEAARRASEIYEFEMRSAIEGIGNAILNVTDNLEGWLRLAGQILQQYLRIREAQGGGASTGFGFLGSLLGGLPSFQTGGVVPGPFGSPQLVVAHGGEEITPVGGGRAPVFNFYGLNLDREIATQLVNSVPSFAQLIMQNLEESRRMRG